MFERTEEVKVMRDPIHGYIHVHYKVIWDCINAREFHRLRRIHQLGGDFQVYHTAEHTRFSHSLGVYEIVRRMVEEIEELSRSLSEYEKCAAMLAGLLHDLGHGPFSHAFEAVSDCHHEQFTQRILLEDSEIHRILSAADVRLPQDVADIIGYRYKNDLLNQLVSGQLDADRMDYLLRDAYFTGTSYGTFDMERILRTIRIQDAHLAVKESGIHSVEDYIMARYHMYWQVYLHPVARSYEIMIALLFERMKTLWKQKPSFFAGLEMFTPFLSESVSPSKRCFAWMKRPPSMALPC
ncbi:MAG: HD domain-containing protein [Merdibacter sp.]